MESRTATTWRALRPNVPPAVGWLCALLVLGYLAEVAVLLRGGPAELDALLHRFGLVPREFLAGRVLGLFSSVFLHAGPLHVLSNLLVLAWCAGGIAERSSRPRWVALFWAGAIAGGLCHVAARPDGFVAALGASGAAAAFFGAFVRLRAWRTRSAGAPVAAGIALWLATPFVAGSAVEAGIAAWAHLGGFLAGVFSTPQVTPVTPRDD